MASKKTPMLRKKRVFIDLEYITPKDLERSLKELFYLISQGKEKNEEISMMKEVELLTFFKQWYVYPYRDITEVQEGNQIIHKVKSSV